MMLPDPAVVVVAYGDPQHLKRCLDTLGAPAGAVVVVDNGLDDVAEDLARASGARYLRPPSNVGFATGVNLGLRVSPHADVLLLNPDAELRWEDVLRLQGQLRLDERRAAVAPRLARPDGGDEPASWPMPSPWTYWLDALGLSRWNRGPRFLTGAALLLRAEAIAELGGLDERFFLYAEESDWQKRALVAGWTVAVVPELTAVHLGGATSSDEGGRSEHFDRSARLFAAKWYGRPGMLSMRLASLVAAVRRLLTGRASLAGVRRQLRSTTW